MTDEPKRDNLKHRTENTDLAKQVEQTVISEWEAITICNDFVFCKIMQDEELLSELIRLILPDLKFKQLSVQAQRAVDIGVDIHGVRFDIFVTLEDGSVVEIEMQVLDTGNLPKRLRFYGSMADTQMLEKGVVYSKLRDSYVIMICPFDPYGEERHIYTFTNRCKENTDLEMGDDTTKIVLNANGTMDDVSDRLKAFLDYVAGKTVDDEYVKKLDDAVKKARANKEWRREYMTLMMRDLENQEIGIEKGRKEGREEGREEGRDEERRNVIERMLRDGRAPETIADFCKYPLQLIQEVQHSMLSSL